MKWGIIVIVLIIAAPIISGRVEREELVLLDLLAMNIRTDRPLLILMSLVFLHRLEMKEDFQIILVLIKTCLLAPTPHFS